MERQEIVADDHRHDGSFADAGIIAERPEAGPHVVRVFPESLTALGFGGHDVDTGEYRGARRRRHRGAEDERPRLVLEVLDHLALAGDEPTDRSERLAERADDEIDLRRESEVLGGTGAGLAEDADRVRVVDHETGVVLGAELDQAREIDDVAFHTEHAVNDDQFAAAIAVAAGELGLEIAEITVAEPDGVAG